MERHREDDRERHGQIAAIDPPAPEAAAHEERLIGARDVVEEPPQHHQRRDSRQCQASDTRVLLLPHGREDQHVGHQEVLDQLNNLCHRFEWRAGDLVAGRHGGKALARVHRPDGIHRAGESDGHQHPEACRGDDRAHPPPDDQNRPDQKAHAQDQVCWGDRDAFDCQAPLRGRHEYHQEQDREEPALSLLLLRHPLSLSRRAAARSGNTPCQIRRLSDRSTPCRLPVRPPANAEAEPWCFGCRAARRYRKRVLPCRAATPRVGAGLFSLDHFRALSFRLRAVLGPARRMRYRASVRYTRASCSTWRRSEKRSHTLARPARPWACAHSGFDRSDESAAASASGSSGGTRRPVCR